VFCCFFAGFLAFVSQIVGFGGQQIASTSLLIKLAKTHFFTTNIANPEVFSFEIEFGLVQIFIQKNLTKNQDFVLAFSRNAC